MTLELHELTVELAGRTIVDRLELEAPRGAVTGLVGPNGSGKSTALRCVYRALRPARGAILVDGDDILGLRLRDSATRVAALAQEGGADLDFTVEEVVALGRTPHKRGGEALTTRERDLVAEAMRRLDIAHLADRGVLGLSGGERQRVLIARTLVQEAAVLVLDEPTNHLDLRHQLQLLSLVRREGTTALVVLHDLNLAAAACDRVAVLDGGRLVATGEPREVLTPELVARVFGVDVEVVAHPLTGRPQLLFSLDAADRAATPPGRNDS